MAMKSPKAKGEHGLQTKDHWEWLTAAVTKRQLTESSLRLQMESIQPTPWLQNSRLLNCELRKLFEPESLICYSGSI